MSETKRAARDSRGTAATRWSEDQARPIVEAWRESGKSIEAFARDAGVGAWRLRYWAPRLEMREVARTRATKKAKQEQRIVPAVVKIGEPMRAPAIVVRLPDGVEVELHDVAQVDAGEIAELVKRLREASA
jgi:hypothetical protein